MGDSDDNGGQPPCPHDFRSIVAGTPGNPSLSAIAACSFLGGQKYWLNLANRSYNDDCTNQQSRGRVEANPPWWACEVFSSVSCDCWVIFDK